MIRWFMTSRTTSKPNRTTVVVRLFSTVSARSCVVCVYPDDILYAWSPLYILVCSFLYLYMYICLLQWPNSEFYPNMHL